MYKLGTLVSYRSEGVCSITEVKQQKFGKLDTPKDFYVLSPIGDTNSKIYIPLDNEILVSKMSPLCSAEQINDLAERLCGKTMEWIKESRQRTNAFKAIIADCKREQLILLINTVYERKQFLEAQGKRLTQSDEAALKKAQTALIAEFSVTTDISNEELLMEVLLCKTKCKPKV